MKVKSYTIELSEQMAVCDGKCTCLLKLLGDARNSTCRLIALPDLGQYEKKDQISVSLEVLEKFKYTSTIRIRQILSQTESTDNNHPQHYSAPEMIVRVYHDAKTAEVISYQNHKYFKAVYPVPNQFMYQCDEKEQLNLFLAEWLNLCLNEGLGNPDDLQLEKLIC